MSRFLISRLHVHELINAMISEMQPERNGTEGLRETETETETAGAQVQYC